MFAPFLGAGFYYKTFMWPRAAGRSSTSLSSGAQPVSARAADSPIPIATRSVYAHCDVLIVGAGPAGLAAALAAAAAGAQIFVCDEQAEMGGSLLAEKTAMIDGLPAADWIAKTLAELGAYPNIKLLPRTTAFGWYPHNFIGLCERVTEHITNADPKWPRERLWQVRAKEVVLATGALERPLVFPDNDRPGIMMAEAARIYVNRFGVKPGGKAVIFTASDSAYRAALDLKAAGVVIAAIVDLRAGSSGSWIDRARAAGIDVRTATVVTATSGRLRIGSVNIAKLDADDRPGASETIACDLLLMSGGFTPSVHLFSQSRGKLIYDEALQAYLPGTSVERERSVGASRGLYDLETVLNDGTVGGTSAAQAAGFSGAVSRTFAVSADRISTDGFIGVTPHGRNPLKVRAWIDFQNDVTAKDVELAIHEGFRSIEHVKRYTTTGMATDQGKTSNMNALGLVSARLQVPVPQVGLTTFRPPYTPTTFGVFAGQSRGDLFDPLRKTPIHDWAVAQGAVFEDVSLWKRARYFPRAGENMHAAVARECKATRQAVGIFDATTLGKIEVVGKDAAELMNRTVYQRLDQARAGPAALRPDAARGWVCDGRRRGWQDGAGPLPYHDYDRRRVARPGDDGRLRSDRMVRPRCLADFDDRAMGRHRLTRSAGP